MKLSYENNHFLSLLVKARNQTRTEFVRKASLTGDELQQAFVFSRDFKIIFGTDVKTTHNSRRRNDAMFRGEYKFVNKNTYDGIECGEDGECWLSSDKDDTDNIVVVIAVVASGTVVLVVIVAVILVLVLRRRSMTKRPLGDLPSRKGVHELSQPVYTGPVYANVESQSTRNYAYTKVNGQLAALDSGSQDHFLDS